MCHLASTRNPPASGNALNAARVGLCCPRIVRVPTALPKSVPLCRVTSTRLSSVNRRSGYVAVSRTWCIMPSRIASPVTIALAFTVTSPRAPRHVTVSGRRICPATASVQSMPTAYRGYNGTCTVSATAAYPVFGDGGRTFDHPELRPSPGYHEGSSGHVVAHKWFKCGDTCHHARLALWSTVKTTCDCAWAARRKNGYTNSAARRPLRRSFVLRSIL